MPGEPALTTIRLATPDDVAAVAALRADWTGGAGDATYTARLERWWRQEADRRTTWLAEQRSWAVGMASLVAYVRMPQPGRCDAAWGYVSTLYVREVARGRGVGARLLAALVAEAEARGYGRLVTHPSEQAVPLYERAGFRLADGSAGGTALLVRAGDRPAGGGSEDAGPVDADPG